jgi:hypothetical protein
MTILTQAGVVGVVLVELIERCRLYSGRTAIPDRNWEVLRSILIQLIGKDILKCLGPGYSIIESWKIPELLEEVKE